MRVERTETKFMLSPDEYGGFLHILPQLLVEDKYNGAYGYRISSLYFDSLFDCDFYDKVEGVERRKKVRLRIYGDTFEKIKLEVKYKDNIYQVKESMWISKEDALALQACDYSVLLNYSDPLAEKARRILMDGAYRPTVRVDYLRKAFIGEANTTRITLDTELRVSELTLDIFKDDQALVPIPGQYFAILEVKSTGELPYYIKKHIDGLSSSSRAVSKYRNARWFAEEIGLL